MWIEQGVSAGDCLRCVKCPNKENLAEKSRGNTLEEGILVVQNGERLLAGRG